MKRVQEQSENTFENLSFETLNNDEMRQLVGGAKKTKDRDVFDFEEE